MRLMEGLAGWRPPAMCLVGTWPVAKLNLDLAVLALSVASWRPWSSLGAEGAPEMGRG